MSLWVKSCKVIIKMKLLSVCKSAIQQVKINIDGGAIQMLLGRWVGGGWGEGGSKGTPTQFVEPWILS